MRRRCLPDRSETILDLFMRMKKKRDDVRTGTVVFRPLTGRMSSDMPDQCDYWKCVALLDGYLIALDWNYEEKEPEKTDNPRYSKRAAELVKEFVEKNTKQEK